MSLNVNKNEDANDIEKIIPNKIQDSSGKFL